MLSTFNKYIIYLNHYLSHTKFYLIPYYTNIITADITTDYNSYFNFIKEYTGKKYVSERITVIILLATHPELQKEIESKFLTNKQQRTELMKDVRKLRRLLKEEPVSFLKDFRIMIIRRSNYVW